jgi:NADH:ubiquinone oxidoreductase subunit D
MLIRSLVKSLKLSIESNKGIYSIFISSFPFSCINIISNDFLVINEINNITKYINLADLITILGSIDFVLGSVDLT